jgi:hypothetical protein
LTDAVEKSAYEKSEAPHRGLLKVALTGPPLPFESGDPNLSLNA